MLANEPLRVDCGRRAARVVSTSRPLDQAAPGCRSALALRLLVAANDKQVDLMGDHVTQEQAFAPAKEVLEKAVGGDIHNCGDIILIPGLVNLDFEDVKTVMSEPGKAMMGTAVGSGPD